MRLFVVLLSLALVLGAERAAAQGDPVIQFEVDDAEMNAAMAEARRTLPRFLKAVTDGEGYGPPSASIKVAFPVDDEGGTEIIWVGPFQDLGGGQFRGLLANHPNWMGDLKAGDEVRFEAEMVRDWSHMDDAGRLWGNYTTRVMLPQLSPDERQYLSGLLSPGPVPDTW